MIVLVFNWAKQKFVKKLAHYWASRTHSNSTHKKNSKVHQAQLIQSNKHQGKTMHIINVSKSRIKASKPSVSRR
jgi:hypothetical protein